MTNNFEYDYEEIPRKKRYKNPDDMLKTIPGIDPMSYKKGIIGFVTGIISFITAFIFIIWAWIVAFILAGIGLYFTLSQRKRKKTKISNVALIINIVALIVFSVLIVLDLFTDNISSLNILFDTLSIV